ncbi:MAG: hypothetical protein FJX65_06820 [Alphaproteobacteria bacterium]|nr:hypothetical protein [Alphaproteobacteria bacterium]
MKKRWEVLVYNKLVRDLVEQDQHHRYYKDDWADVHHEQVEAPDLAGARRRATARYPARDGFVIVEINEAKDDEDEAAPEKHRDKP